MSLDGRMKEDQERVDVALNRWLPQTSESPSIVHKAMRYSIFAGGKRFRPILLLEACRVVGGDIVQALPAAAALEMIHTYSLIHDDLPCMDNASLRRGQPTCHRKFNETIAVLAGDALLTHAFMVLAVEQIRSGVDPVVAARVTGLIADAAGTAGMVGGQVLDIQHAGTLSRVSTEQLFEIHNRKTGALIRAAVESGAMIGGASTGAQAALRTYGEQIGLAFQIADDLLEIEGDVQTMGKDLAGDEAQEKITFPAVFGPKESAEMAHESLKAAESAVEEFGDKSDFLRSLAEFVVNRKH